MDDKRRLREWARSQPPVTSGESAAVVRSVAAWLDEQPRTAVLTYLSMPGEVAAERAARADDHRWLTTRTPAHGPLTVHPLDGPREIHDHGFEQPVAGAERVDELSVIGVVLVPGLCFDRRGGRLGRGRGYYDRLLSRLPGARRVGVTVERLMVDCVPVEEHDVPMTHLVTERGVTEVAR